jgi:autoinducer 2-degrading protein
LKNPHAKVILSGYIIVPDNELEIVKQALISHMKLTHEEVGCLTFKVIPDEKNKNKFSVYEEFIDQAAFDHHQTRVKTSQWAKLTINVERHYEIHHI